MVTLPRLVQTFEIIVQKGMSTTDENVPSVESHFHDMCVPTFIQEALLLVLLEVKGEG